MEIMDLKLNIQSEVNIKQYLFVKEQLKGLFAYRTENGKFFIKPLLFQGCKKQIEQILLKLS